MAPTVGAALLVAYLLLSIEMFLATYTLGRFKIAHGGLGGTELRIALAARQRRRLPVAGAAAARRAAVRRRRDRGGDGRPRQSPSRSSAVRNAIRLRDEETLPPR